MKFKKRIPWLFVGSVVVPTLLSTAYYGFQASDLYVSEARINVQRADSTGGQPLGGLFGGLAIAGNGGQIDAVKGYLSSRDIVAYLDRAVGLRKQYSSEQIDWINRFPGWFADESLESFTEYFGSYLTVNSDPASSVVTIRVAGYSPESVSKTGEAALDAAEALVNRLNERMRKDMLSAAETELRAAENRLRSAEMSLASYRNSRGIVNPEKEAALQVERIEKLRDTLLQAEARLDQVRAVANDNPQLPSLQKHVDALRKAIRESESRATGSAKSLSSQAPWFQKLQVERDLAARQLALAAERYDRAQVEAARQQIYLEKIAGPSLPDGALEPRRLRSVLSTFGLSLLLWGVLAVLLAGMREHKEVI